LRALIVEDEIFSANNLKNIVSKQNIEVISIVDNAKDAIALCKKKKPELILMDIMIKGAMSGVEAAVEIKHHVSDEIAIIFLTAYSNKEMIDYAIDANAFAYLLKPYREGEIFATLELLKAKLKTPKKIEIINKSIVFLKNDYHFDIDKNSLYVEGNELAISKHSKRLLHILCKNSHSYVSSEELIQYIWQESDSGSLEALRSLIYRLKHLTKVSFINNNKKVGYKIIKR